jgi:peptidoglycan/xylan/chitin deacetylase (PgdA/CDA1 family)
VHGAGRTSPLVLAYHGVADVPLWQDHYRLFVRPKDLGRQIDRLTSWGYELTTMSELARRLRAGSADGTAALTFDDGLADNAGPLLEVLATRDAPATVYVIAGWLGRPHPDAPWARIATEEQVEKIASAGLEVGAHTLNHVDLSTVPYDVAFRELKDSKDRLEQITGSSVESAAYPFGNASEETLAACRAAGFTSAVRTRGRGSWANLLALPRQDVGNRTTDLALRLKRRDRYEPVMRILNPLLATWPARKGIRLVRLVRWVASH